jgi:hypothetical protein
MSVHYANETITIDAVNIVAVNGTAFNLEFKKVD